MVSSDSGRLIAKFNWSLASGKSTLTSPPKELLDATNHSEGAPLEGKSRGDASERLRQAHEAAGHDKWCKPRVHRVVCAIDCGTVINPNTVAQQMESAVIFGLTAALHGRIDIVEGVVQQSNFGNYPMVQMDQAPVVETWVVPSTRAPGGVGEPGVPPVAPAVANALFALTGKRQRALPLV